MKNMPSVLNRASCRSKYNKLPAIDSLQALTRSVTGSPTKIKGFGFPKPLIMEFG